MLSLDMAKLIAKTIDDKKGSDVRILQVTDKTSLGDYFIIATGTSSTHVRSLSDDVDDVMSKNGIEPKRIEGYQSQSWILMDYTDVIVHIFQKDAREFYSLERLWADAPVIEF